MEPALTAEEWRGLRWPFAYVPELQDEARHRKMYAALALYGQPFGFTWEDIRILGTTIEYADFCGFYDQKEMQDGLNSILGRIAALLPLREQEEL